MDSARILLAIAVLLFGLAFCVSFGGTRARRSAVALALTGIAIGIA